MKEKLLTLISLQECDSQLVKLSAKKTRLPEKIRKMEESFLVFKENTEQNKKKLAQIRAQRAEYEADIKKTNDSVIKTRERLLEVKNNKEYQAMLKEIETAEKTRLSTFQKMTETSRMVLKMSSRLSQGLPRESM